MSLTLSQSKARCSFMDTTTLKKAKHDFSMLGLQLLLIALAIVAIQIMSNLILTACAPNLAENYNVYFLASMLPYYAIGIPGVLHLLKRQNVSPSPEHRMSFRQWLAAFCISYAFMYVSNVFGLFLTQIIGIIKGSPVENIIEEVALDLNPLVAALCMVILAPIFEELLFRKFIIEKTVKYGEGIAIVISALSFGLFHGNFNQFAYAFSLGLFWGFIYVKTRKIKYTIWIHMVINFMGSILPLLMFRSPDQNLLFYILFIFLLVISGLVLFFSKRKKMHLNAGEIVIPKGRRFCTVILNVGMLLNILFWSAQIVIQLFR